MKCSYDDKQYDWIIFKKKGAPAVAWISPDTPLGKLRDLPVKFEAVKFGKDGVWLKMNED